MSKALRQREKCRRHQIHAKRHFDEGEEPTVKLTQEKAK